MKTIKGPAIFLAQFAGDEAPFNTLEDIAGWAANLGFAGVQIPSWDGRLFDLARAAESRVCPSGGWHERCSSPRRPQRPARSP